MAAQDLSGLAFPTLSDEQLRALEGCADATARRFADGETLFRVGERDFGFFVVKTGGVTVLDRSGEAPRQIASHGPGQFTGDVGHLTGAPAVVDAVAQGTTEVIAIGGGQLRAVINQCPGLSDVLLHAFIARRQLLHESADFVGLRVIGSRYSQDTFRVRDFLARNRVLFTWTDLESDGAVAEVLRRFGVTEADTPVVACGGRLLHRNPTDRELAELVGVRREISREAYDLVIVGAGPAGLAAAVYGASEGLKTIVLDRSGPGGQAGRSMRIENYLGFPTGITGAELADRAALQAGKFGATLSVPADAGRLSFDNRYPVVDLGGGESVSGRCLLIATGADYRRLGVEGCERFEGRGVFYAATPNEATTCRGATVIVVGGGNSAGQAAVFLAGHAERVLLVVRGDDLHKNMSSYLVHRIEQTPNIERCLNTGVGAMRGDGHLEGVTLHNGAPGAGREVETPAVFSFIGAVPRTDWLPAEVERDAKGFVRTGPDGKRSPHWKLRREPFLLESTRPGVFAAGDARAGSVKRVASAVGEGSMAVQFVHEYLKEA